MKAGEKPRSRRKVQTDVDVSFYAIVVDALFHQGLHPTGTGIPIARAAELIREGRERGVFPSLEAVEMVVDEIAGAPVVRKKEERRSWRDDG